jgi:hypothetical protein
MSFKERAGQTLPCNECGEVVKNVGADATGVICWKCVAKSLSGNLTETDPPAPAPQEKK